MNLQLFRVIILFWVSFFAAPIANGSVFSCDEAGVLAAIATGGGPHTFSCIGATTVVTSATIAVTNDVVLDGEGRLALDGNASHGVLQIEAGVTAELRGVHVTNGMQTGDGGGIRNGSSDVIPIGGALTLIGCSVTDNSAQGDGGGIANLNGSLVVVDSTIARNSATTGGGISSQSVEAQATDLTLTRSTVSDNSAHFGAGIHISGSSPTLIENTTLSTNFSILGGGALLHEGSGTLDLVHVTIALNFADYGSAISAGAGTTNRFANSIVSDSWCGGTVASLGGNLESPGDSCFFSHATDQVIVPAPALGLGPLMDNGGPTWTQALAAGSVAIDAAQLGECPPTDQRGMPRPELGGVDCDAGAYEAVPEPAAPLQLAAGAAGLLYLGRRRRFKVRGETARRCAFE